MRHLLAVVLSVAAASASAQESVPTANAVAVASPVQKKLERGYRLAGEKKNTEAIAAFQSVLKAEPENHAALVSLGYLYSGVKQWKSAARNFKAASAQEPGDQRLRMDYAYALQGAGDIEGASAEFEQVAAQEGEFKAPAQTAIENLKNAAPAAADLKARKLLEQGYAALSRGDKASARARFVSASVADPKNAAAFKQLGFLNYENGKLSEAARNFEAARVLEPQDGFTALQLGYTYAKLKKDDAAREAFTAASNSTDPKIHDAAVAALNPAL